MRKLPVECDGEDEGETEDARPSAPHPLAHFPGSAIVLA